MSVDEAKGKIIVCEPATAQPRRLARLGFDILTVDSIINSATEPGTQLEVHSKLPADAELAHTAYDAQSDRLYLYYESEEFEPVQQGVLIPDLSWDTVQFIGRRLPVGGGEEVEGEVADPGCRDAGNC